MEAEASAAAAAEHRHASALALAGVSAEEAAAAAAPGRYSLANALSRLDTQQKAMEGPSGWGSFLLARVAEVPQAPPPQQQQQTPPPRLFGSLRARHCQTHMTARGVPVVQQPQTRPLCSTSPQPLRGPGEPGEPQLPMAPEGSPWPSLRRPLPLCPPRAPPSTSACSWASSATYCTRPRAWGRRRGRRRGCAPRPQRRQSEREEGPLVPPPQRQRRPLQGAVAAAAAERTRIANTTTATAMGIAVAAVAAAAAARVTRKATAARALLCTPWTGQAPWQWLRTRARRFQSPRAGGGCA